MAIREQIEAFLKEEKENTSSMISNNVSTFEDRKLDREPGSFTPEEISSTVVIGGDGHLDDNMKIDNTANKANLSCGEQITFFLGKTESVSMEEAIANYLLKEDSEFDGPRSYVPDVRIEPFAVLHALQKELPGVIGMSVNARVDENGEQVFQISGVDWDKYDEKLPKTLNVEQVVLKLCDHEDCNCYKVDSMNKDFPLSK